MFVLFFLEWALVVCILQRIYVFHLNCQIYLEKVSHNISLFNVIFSIMSFRSITWYLLFIYLFSCLFSPTGQTFLLFCLFFLTNWLFLWFYFISFVVLIDNNSYYTIMKLLYGLRHTPKTYHCLPPGDSYVTSHIVQERSNNIFLFFPFWYLCYCCHTLHWYINAIKPSLYF